MKEITKLLLTVICFSVGISLTFAGGPVGCPLQSADFGVGSAGADDVPVTITTCAFVGENATINGIVSGESYTFTYTGGSNNTFISVYDTDSIAVASGDSSVTFTAAKSGTYLSSSTDAGGACTSLGSGCRTLTVICTSCAPAVFGCTDPAATNYDSTATNNDGSCVYPVPSNDSCASAIAVTCASTVSGTTLGASTDGSIGSCGTSLNTAPGVWYSYMGDGSTVTASLCGSSYDTKIGVFSGMCDSLMCEIGNDDDCALQSEVTFGTQVGVAYYIYVTGFSTSAGDYTLSMSCIPPVIGCTDPAAVNYNISAVIDDGSCLYAVSFSVDMSCPDPTTSVDTVFVTGPFCSWCATGFPLTGPDSNGIWTGTYNFPAGNLEYKYMVNNFASQENLIDDMQGGASCAPVTDFFSFANRLINVSGATSVNETYGSCSPCPIGVLGCTDPGAVNYDSTATTDDGSCMYNVSFAVDMNCSGETFSTVSITGPFCGWCGAGFELSDADSNGIYEGTFAFGSPLEYKYMVDGFASQENLIDDMVAGASCAPITDFFSFANRLITFGGDTAVDDNYGSCDDCVTGCTDTTALNYNPLANYDDGSCITSINVTLIVDMCNEVVDSAGVYVAGTFNGWDPAATQMTNIGGTQYAVTIQEAPGAYIQYKFLNGPSFTGEESVPGACGVDNGFGAFDRGGFNLPSADTTFGLVAYGGCGPCVVPTNVTFIINMCGETVDSAGVYLAGSFNGFNPSADQMINIGGTTYSVTLSLTAGQSHTYKHLNGPSFAGAELVPGACGQDDGFGAFNRTFTVPASDTTLGPIRFGSCSEDCPVCTGGLVAHVLTITGGSFPNEIGYSLVNSATGDTAAIGSCGSVGGAGVTDTICLDDSAGYCFEAYDDWGDGWNGGSYTLTELNSGNVVITGSPNNGVAGDASDLCDGSQLEDSVCLNVGTIAGCTDSSAVNYNPAANLDDGSCIYTPANDLCTDAITVSCGDILIGTTFGSSLDTSLGTCGTLLSSVGGVWYSFAGDGSPVTANTLWMNFGTKLGVFEGACDSLICIGGNDDFCGLQSQVVFNTAIGTTYYIYVTGFGSSAGDFNLTITCAILGCTNPAALNYDSLATVDDGSCIFPPANDDCQNATSVACGDSIAGTTIGASVENVPFCGTSLNSAGGVWYSLTGNGDTVTASLCSAAFDTKLGVFEGDCDSLLCIDGIDDFCGLQSQVTFVSSPGTIYYILVTGFGTSNGDFGLEIDCSTTAGCGTPQNPMSSTTTGSGTVNLSWDAVPGATSYIVRGTREGLGGTIVVAPSATNSLQLAGLLTGLDHYWQVQAICVGESSDFSSIDTFNIAPCPAPDSVWITNLTATSATANWSPVPEAIGYFVYANRLGTGISGTAVFGVVAPTTSISGSNLIPGATYQVAVVAKCDYNSDPSPIDTFTTLVPPSKTGIDHGVASNVAFKMYPNPAQNELNIELSTFEAIEEVNVAIFDLQGQLILEIVDQTVNNNLNINLPSELVNGVYQVHVRYADRFHNEKLVIVR